MNTPARQLRTQAPRLVEIATRRARLSVVPRRRVRAPRVPFVTLVSLILVGGVVGLLCFNTQMQQASFTLTTLQERADTLGARQQSLADDVTDLQSPINVSERAAKLGLVAPESSAMLSLATGTVSGEAIPATNANTPPLQGRAPTKPAEINPAPTIVKVTVDPAVLAAQQAAEAAAQQAAADAAAQAAALAQEQAQQQAAKAAKKAAKQAAKQARQGR